jgi:uncharacterized membrane protein YqjE
MDFPSSHATPPPEDGGVLAAIMTFVGSITRHFVALGGLAKTEAEEALANFLRILVYAVLGLVFAIFGYLIFLLFFAFLLDVVFGLNWIWTTLGLAVLHFVLVGICAWNVRAAFQTPMFTSTMQEVRRDISILTRNPGVSGVTNPVTPTPSGPAGTTQPAPPTSPAPPAAI